MHASGLGVDSGLEFLQHLFCVAWRRRLQAKVCVMHTREHLFVVYRCLWFMGPLTVQARPPAAFTKLAP